ncbi:hypothetical protein [Emticicia sp. C21]|uniref:hypothetical protein n=1 Tax=Emticicia sp. C21 TaxID=2302915 RepID=UPI000E34F27D|nr:hypothetical protein [Emticicia sp. C21]RFS16162.1 hypothetical protein D0T08_10750 [Emticicia sp. C21]
MEYRFGEFLHVATNRFIPTLRVEEPLSELSILSSVDDIEDLDCYIEQIEDIINRDVPDSSELGGIFIQGILWGSDISTLIDLDNPKFIDKNKEFKTIDLLALCKKWREFIIYRSR